MLVKSSWFGNDPNWGRIMDAVGYARVGVDLNCMSSYYSDGIGERRAEPPEHLVPTVLKGVPQFDCENEWRKIVEKRNFTIVINLGMGSAKYILMSTDLSEAYVDFNKSE